MNDDNYLTINEQGLAEINPTASSDVQDAFIDAYRNMQGENTAQIGAQAHALGSDLEAQYGGLHGPSEYMKSRYQTPQTESRLAGLRTASQLSALNQLMQNDINSWKDKYSQAYRNAQKRARDRARAAAAAAAAAAASPKGGVQQDVYDEYGIMDTLSLSDNDYSASELPEGANRITRTGGDGWTYDEKTGKYVPIFTDTADNSNVPGSETTIGRYPGFGNVNGAETPIDLIGQMNLPETAWNVTQFMGNPIGTIGSWLGQGARNLIGW